MSPAKKHLTKSGLCLLLRLSLTALNTRTRWVDLRGACACKFFFVQQREAAACHLLFFAPTLANLHSPLQSRLAEKGRRNAMLVRAQNQHDAENPPCVFVPAVREAEAAAELSTYHSNRQSETETHTEREKRHLRGSNTSRNSRAPAKISLCRCHWTDKPHSRETLLAWVSASLKPGFPDLLALPLRSTAIHWSKAPKKAATPKELGTYLSTGVLVACV